MYKVFIDGQAGTTGLKIHHHLDQRKDLEILQIEDSQRKNPDAKRAVISAADLVVLCLPDAAAVETVQLAESCPHTRILDASTAHRINPAWTYGLAELKPGQRSQISGARLVSNPGCWATGFLLAITPLVSSKLLPADTILSVNGVSGYSGGGRTMIESYRARSASHPDDLWYSRPYRLQFGHKHIAEMTRYSGLAHAPLFMPSVGHFPQGMLVNIPVASRWLTRGASVSEITSLLSDYYADEACIHVHTANDETSLADGFMEPQENNGTNRLDLFVFGNDDQFLMTARLDNLGKGASGAAVQNLNLMFGLDEFCGLAI